MWVLHIPNLCPSSSVDLTTYLSMLYLVRENETQFMGSLRIHTAALLFREHRDIFPARNILRKSLGISLLLYWYITVLCQNQAGIFPFLFPLFQPPLWAPFALQTINTEHSVWVCDRNGLTTWKSKPPPFIFKTGSQKSCHSCLFHTSTGFPSS